jgi:hypothetical protein
MARTRWRRGEGWGRSSGAADSDRWLHAAGYAGRHDECSDVGTDGTDGRADANADGDAKHHARAARWRLPASARSLQP